MSVRLSKEDSEKLLDERKETVKKVCLKKQDMSHLTSRVALVLDVSGSMAEAFQSGMVQATLERLLPLAMAFDDDGSMEVWTFTHEFKRHPPLTRQNFYNYIEEYGLKAGGGTFYSPVMCDVGKYFIKEEPAKLPTYVIFITDGNNLDTKRTDVAIKAISRFPIFFQFVGIGESKISDFRYLCKLDEMENRYVDNANFFAIRSLADIDIISDTELYTKLLDEYPKWLSYPKVREMISRGDKLARVNKKWLKQLDAKRLDNVNERPKFEINEKTLTVIGVIIMLILHYVFGWDFGDD